MKRNIRFMTLFILAFTACILLTSCQNRTIQEDAETSSSAAGPSATEGGTVNSPAETEPGHAETTGSSVDASADEDHQITPEDTDAGSFSAGVKSIGQFYEYNGGEMVFEYSVDSMGGLAPDNVGIMVYLNGTPLPFSVEGIDNEEMAYFHILRA